MFFIGNTNDPLFTLSPYKHALVLEDLRCLYVQMPKVACKSVKKAFFALSGRPQEEFLDWEREHLRVVDLSDSRYRDWFKFTFVRNPWDRVVSCFENKFRHPRPDKGKYEDYVLPLKEFFETEEVAFDQFAWFVSKCPDDMANEHWRSQFTFIMDGGNNLLVDFAGRFESLERDFREACRRIGCRARLPHEGKSSHRAPYREYYDAKSLERISKRYLLDSRVFKYSF